MVASLRDTLTLACDQFDELAVRLERHQPRRQPLHGLDMVHPAECAAEHRSGMQRLRVEQQFLPTCAGKSNIDRRPYAAVGKLTVQA